MSDPTPADADLAELLDDDNLPVEYPPERPLGVEDPGVTADHAAIGDSVAERAAREEPEQGLGGPPSSDDGALGHLLEPDEGAAPDTEADVVGRAVGTDEVGSVEAGEHVAADPTLRDVATERVDDRSAEELAVHVTEDPPFLSGDSYLDDVAVADPALTDPGLDLDDDAIDAAVEDGALEEDVRP